MHLTSYIKNPVDRHTDNGREYFTVAGTGSLRGVLVGRGILYSWIQGVSEDAVLNCQFALSQMTPAQYTANESGEISIELEAQSRFPCSGIITSTGEGYIISPAFKLDPVKGQDIVLMLLAPRTSPYNVAVDKNVLAIPKDESEVIVTSDGGEVRCSGAISSQSKRASIVLNRNPRLPVYRAGFNETLSLIRGGGQISASWKPVARSFEELAMAFYPSKMNPYDPNSAGLDRVANYLGVPALADTRKFGDYVVGDGAGVNYTLRLRIDRGLRRHESDETRLTVM